MGFGDLLVVEATKNTLEELELARRLVARQPDAAYLLAVLELE